MKKIFALILAILFCRLTTFAEQTKVLTAGISVERVPKAFYGTWRVSSQLVETNSGIFKTKNIDLWNLSRKGNVIKLENPFSGASASITISELSNNYIKFTKTGNYDGKKLADSVKLNLKQNSFTGYNTLKLDTISEDGYVMKSEVATYKLTGEKISGTSVK